VLGDFDGSHELMLLLYSLNRLFDDAKNLVDTVPSVWAVFDGQLCAHSVHELKSHTKIIVRLIDDVAGALLEKVLRLQ
jgi:hypothetical protein